MKYSTLSYNPNHVHPADQWCASCEADKDLGWTEELHDPVVLCDDVDSEPFGMVDCG